MTGPKDQRHYSSAMGLEMADSIRAAGGGRKMFLTSPFIEQAISLACAFYSPPPPPKVREGDLSSIIARPCFQHAVFVYI